MPPTTRSLDTHRHSRRKLLRLGLAGTVGSVAAALGGSDRGTRPNTQNQRPPDQSATTSTQPSDKPTGAAPKVLVAYFSRAGENYYYGDRIWLDVGNTQVVAETIAESIPCDLHRIEASEPYPDDYDKTVERNTAEQEADARPAIANPLDTIDQYDVVLLGSPIWNVRAPMIMTTFTESHDFTAKTVHPLTTHAMSELGTTERDYAQTCTGANIGEGLAIRGERAGNAGPEITRWLRRIGLTGRH